MARHTHHYIIADDEAVKVLLDKRVWRSLPLLRVIYEMQHREPDLLPAFGDREQMPGAPHKQQIAR